MAKDKTDDIDVARDETPDPAVATKAGLSAQGATPPAAPAEQDAAAQPADTQDDRRTELNQAQDRALRLQAELENYRKRAAREMQDVVRYAHLSLMRDLLPVLDHLSLATDAAEQAHDVDNLLQGVKMVVQQFEDVLRKHHCVKIEALGEPFDPHRHEAIFKQVDEKQPPGTVLEVKQTGYRLHDRVVRPSQVVVAEQSCSPGAN